MQWKEIMLIEKDFMKKYGIIFQDKKYESNFRPYSEYRATES